MFGRAMKMVVVLALATAGLAGTAVGPAAAATCSTSPTRVLSGAQTPFTSTLTAGERVDANAATWAPSTTMPYPIYFDSTADSCWDGGRVTGTFPVNTSWSVYHDTAGMGVSGSNVVVDHPRIFNVGDGIRIRDNADGWTVRNAYLSYIHDDCIENDRLVNGTIDNSFLDGCYVGISTRRPDADTTTDGHLNTVTLNNSLVRLQAMPTVYSGEAAGSGGFFKWDTSAAKTSPKLSITNTIFRADQTTNHQDLQLPAGYSVTCSNNTMVWLGPGAYPGTLPSCFTITTDRSVWDAAARAWDVAHPGVITGPEVSVGDASIVEGNSGSRTMRFPVSLNVPPGLNKTVSVYWSTAPGTAKNGTDFTAAKGKLTFTGSQVMKYISVAVKPDTSDEQNESMYVVLAGVDGGENHRERGTGTIVDDDPSSAGLYVSDATVVEGDSGARTLVLPIAVSVPPGVDVNLHWSTVNGTAVAGSDFTGKAGTVKLGASARMVTVSIPITVDTTSEGTETFQVVVDSAPGITIVDGTGTVTIRDDD